MSPEAFGVRARQESIPPRTHNVDSFTRVYHAPAGGKLIRRAKQEPHVPGRK
jgi:hypothetical protein